MAITIDELTRELERTPVAGLPALLARAFEAGRAVGQAAERDRVADAKAQIADALRSLGVVIEASQPTAIACADSSEGRDYGDVMRLVRLIVDDRLEPGEPFGASDIAKAIRKNFPDDVVEMKQIHNAIKGMHRQRHILRVGRGEYVQAENVSRFVGQPDPDAKSGPATPNQGDLPMTQDDTA
ncbi:MAG: hypothetical protein RIC83_00845 [Alphaproteobacteria bacterium]